MNIGVRFVKSFSKGQITIPKEIRDLFGIGEDFWLKLSVDHGKIIAEPVEIKKGMSKEEYRKKLLSIKGVWDLRGDIKEIRKEIGERLKRNAI